ncbi:MAG: hypothetical protein D6698_01530 [Gammaproteobacteria bacterium]|nr:MAG: hypothetical protein D6698_01530 [Gammaproteobacteria bacterium]
MIIIYRDIYFRKGNKYIPHSVIIQVKDNEIIYEKRKARVTNFDQWLSRYTDDLEPDTFILYSCSEKEQERCHRLLCEKGFQPYTLDMSDDGRSSSGSIPEESSSERSEV